MNCLQCGTEDKLTKHHIFRSRSETICLCEICHRMIHTAEDKGKSVRKLRRAHKRDAFLIRLGALLRNESDIFEIDKLVEEIRALEQMTPPEFEPDPKIPYTEQKNYINDRLKSLGNLIIDDWQRGWWYRHLALLKEWGATRHLTLAHEEPDKMLNEFYSMFHNVMHRVGWKHLSPEEQSLFDDVRSYLRGKGVISSGGSRNE
jgi:hypothetical protein